MLFPWQKRRTSCKVCGREHGDLPHLSASAPDHWSEALEQDPDSHLDEDLCIVQARDFFVRAVIEIPVRDGKEPFGWGVWVSLRRENFELYREHPRSGELGPFFGWLSTGIADYREDTLNLKTRVHFRGDGLRPLVELHPCDHPLYRQQQEGISLDQAWEIVHRHGA